MWALSQMGPSSRRRSVLEETEVRRCEVTQPNLTGALCQHEGDGAAFQRPASGELFTFCVSPWSSLSQECVDPGWPASFLL